MIVQNIFKLTFIGVLLMSTIFVWGKIEQHLGSYYYFFLWF